MENPFKIGDKVKILPKDDSTNYLPLYTYAMERYAGQLATIINISRQSCQINLDRGVYYWPFNALQLVTSEVDKTVNPSELKNGDYIKLTNTYTKTSLIYLFKEVKDDVIYKHAAYSLSNKNISVDLDRHWFVSKTTKINYATEEERKLLNKALLEQGFVWNDLTKQLDFIGLIDLNVQPIDFSTFKNSIQKATDVTNLLSCTEKEPQTETELNLFPKKKHYQLNFNY